MKRRSREELHAELDKKIIGQKHAKKAIVAALSWNHERMSLVKQTNIPPKFSVLLAGPSGCGKTSLVEAAAAAIDIPLVSVNCTSLTMPGLKGVQLEDVLARFPSNDLSTPLRGILLLDEIDKLRRKNSGGEHNTLSTQQQLLSLLESESFPFSSGSRTMTLTGITIFAAGAFRDRFHYDTSPIAAEPLIAWGLMPELVGRFTFRASLAKFSEDGLIEILERSENSPILRLKNLYKLSNLELHFDREVLIQLVRESASNETGVRLVLNDLYARFSDLLANRDEFARQNIGRIIVTLECLNGGPPLLVPSSRSQAVPLSKPIAPPSRAKYFVDSQIPGDASLYRSALEALDKPSIRPKALLHESSRSKIEVVADSHRPRESLVRKRRIRCIASLNELMYLQTFRGPRILPTRRGAIDSAFVESFAMRADGGNITSVNWNTSTRGLRMLREILEGVGSVHDAGYLMGNLRPEHILIHTNQVWLTGFAYATEGPIVDVAMAQDMLVDEEFFGREPDIDTLDTTAEIYTAARIIAHHIDPMTPMVRPTVADLLEAIVRNNVGRHGPVDDYLAATLHRLLVEGRSSSTITASTLAHELAEILRRPPWKR